MVALVAEFFLAGNVVYIDHGNGIVTGYFHMSKPEVAAGDTVERGQEIGLVEATGRAHGVEYPMQGTLGISNGERLWAIRYSSEHKSRTLYVSADRATVQGLYPDNPRFQRLTDEDRLVVSEPLSDLPGVWNAVPESTALVTQPGADEQLPFEPRMPALAGSAA